MSCWRFGRAVFRDAAFHVVMWVLRFVVWVFEYCVGGLLVICGGCEYSFIGSLYFNISFRSVSGKNGNLFVNMLRFMFWLFCFIKLYISLWIELGGWMRFWFVCVNCVYGCVFRMCLSGGFCNVVICSNNIVVQSGVGVCDSSWLHVSMFGLMVVMSAYNILGGGWCWFWYMYFDRCGYLVIVSWCFGCVRFMVGENCLLSVDIRVVV